MKIKYFYFSIFLALFSCNKIKETAKSTINKSGEIVSKSGAEFADGLKKGVDETFKNELILSDQLKKEHIEVGKLDYENDDVNGNKVKIYLIFKKPINKKITVKLLDSEKKEYARIDDTLIANENQSKNIEWNFGKTFIQSRGFIKIE